MTSRKGRGSDTAPPPQGDPYASGPRPTILSPFSQLLEDDGQLPPYMAPAPPSIDQPFTRRVQPTAQEAVEITGQRSLYATAERRQQIATTDYTLLDEELKKTFGADGSYYDHVMLDLLHGGLTQPSDIIDILDHAESLATLGGDEWVEQLKRGAAHDLLNSQFDRTLLDFAASFEEVYAGLGPDPAPGIVEFLLGQDLDDLQLISSLADTPPLLKALVTVLEQQSFEETEREAEKLRAMEEMEGQVTSAKRRLQSERLRRLFNPFAAESWAFHVNYADRYQEILDYHQEQSDLIQADPRRVRIRYEVDRIMANADMTEMYLPEVLDQMKALPEGDHRSPQEIVDLLHEIVVNDVTLAMDENRELSSEMMAALQAQGPGLLARSSRWVWETATKPGSVLRAWSPDNYASAQILKPVREFLYTAETAETEREFDSRRREISEMASPEGLNRFANQIITQSWDDLQQVWNNEIVGTVAEEDMLTLAGGDPTLAFQLWAATVTTAMGNDEEVSSLADEVAVSLMNEALRSLEEDEFLFTEKVPSVLAWYGKYIPFQLGTAASLLLFDEDTQDNFFASKAASGKEAWDELWLAVKANDYTPSRAAGWEGTFTGLAIDIAAGVIFDPTTYVLGPKGINMMTSQYQIRRYVTSPLAQRVWLEAGEAGMDVARHGSFAASVSWMGEYSTDLWRVVKRGGVDTAEELTALVTESATSALRQGYRPDAASRTSFARLMGKTIEEAPTGVLEQWVMPTYAQRRIAALPRSAQDDIMGIFNSLGSSADEWNDWSARLMDFYLEEQDSVLGTVDTLNGYVYAVDELNTAGATHELPEFLVAPRGDDPLTLGQTAVFHFSDGTTKTTKVPLLFEDSIRDMYKNLEDVWKWLKSKAAEPGREDFAAAMAAVEENPFAPNAVFTQYYDELISSLDAPPFRGSSYQIDDVTPTSDRLIIDGATEGTAAGLSDRGLTSPGLPGDVRLYPAYRALGGDDALLEHTLRHELSHVRSHDEIYRAGTADDVAAGSAPPPSDVFMRGVDEPITTGAHDFNSEYQAQADAYQWLEAQYGANKLGRTGLSSLDPSPPAWLPRAGVQEDLGSVSLVPGLFETPHQTATLRRFSGTLNSTVADLQREMARLASQVIETYTQRGSKLNDLVNDVLIEYNHKHVLPKWREAIENESTAFAHVKSRMARLSNGNDVEILDWDSIRYGTEVDDPLFATGRLAPEHGRELLSDGTRELLEQNEALQWSLGRNNMTLADLEKTMEVLLNVTNQRLTIDMPISPFLLKVAGTRGYADYMRFTHVRGIKGVRNFFAKVMHWWTKDKIMTPRTVATVWSDEAIRGFHNLGPQYALDTLGRKVAKVETWFRNKTGTLDNLSDARRAYYDEVINSPKKYVLEEAAVNERMGLGYHDIPRGGQNFEEAASRQIFGLVTDDAVYAFLQGEEAFTSWVTTQGSGAAMARRAGAAAEEAQRFSLSAIDMTTGNLVKISQTPAEMYASMEAWMSFVMFPDIPWAESRRLLLQLAEQVRPGNTGGVRPPSRLLEAMPVVRGRQRKPTAGGFTGFTDAITDRLFQGGTDARRTITYKVTRASELRRLETLYRRLGVEILDPAAAAERLGVGWLGRETAEGASDLLDTISMGMFGRNGQPSVITRTHLEKLADRAAMEEVYNSLYKWNMSSLAGKSARVPFPFAGPFFEMWAHWGRNLTRRAEARGIWYKAEEALRRGGDPKTVAWLEDVLNLGPNLRTTSTVSRLANLDLDLENADIPGLEGVDFSPLFFLPTKEGGDLSVMVPQFGPLPLALIDLYAERYIKDPTEFKHFIDALSQVQPFAGFSRGANIGQILANRFVQGGVLGRTLEVGADSIALAVSAAGGNASNGYVGSVDRWLSGDLTRRTNWNRYALAFMSSNADQWVTMLNDVEDDEDFEALLHWATKEAYESTLTASITETVLSMLLPVRTNPNVLQAKQIQEAWFNWAQTRPDLFRQIDTEDFSRLPPDQRGEFADKVRTSFFRSLSPDERARAIVENPGLAASVVPNWRWTSSAKSSDEVDTTFAYDVNGTTESLDQHDLFLRRGWIEPLLPEEITKASMMSYVRAQQRVYTNTFVQLTEAVNEYWWNDWLGPAGPMKDAVWQVSGPDIDNVASTDNPQWNQQIRQFFGGDFSLGNRLSRGYDWMQDNSIITMPSGFDDAEKVRWMWELLTTLRGEFGVEFRWEEVLKADPQGDMEFARNLINDIFYISSGQDSIHQAAWTVPPMTQSNWIGGAPNQISELQPGDVTFFETQNPELAANLKTVGIDTEQLNGEELWLTVAGKRNSLLLSPGVSRLYAENQGLLADLYDSPEAQGTNTLFNLLMQPQEDESVPGTMREMVNRTVFQDAVYRNHIEDGNDLNSVDKQVMRDLFRGLTWQLPEHENVLNDYWEMHMRRTYGDLHFTTPVPPGIFEEDGGRPRKNAFQPNSYSVVDGDTLLITNLTGGPIADLMSDVPNGTFKIRLIGVLAEDYTVDPDVARTDSQTLIDALDGEHTVWLVPDPDLTGAVVDRYGRLLAWLYIDGEPFWQGADGFLHGG